MVAAATWAPNAAARPNTHGPAISTWDVRASSVAFSARRATSGDVEYQGLGVNANFSSTSGLLSAQFGVHYLTFKEPDPEGPNASGASLGGTAMIHLPFGKPSTGILPPGAFNLYIGGLPTVIVGVERNYLSLPLLFGAGLSWSPHQRLSFTPWFELSRSLDLDSRLQAVDTQNAVDAAQDGLLTKDDVETLVKDGLDLDVVSNTSTRWGLNASLHVAPRMDVDLNVVLGAGSRAGLALGVALVFRWDDFVGMQVVSPPVQSVRSVAAPAAPTPTGKVPPTSRYNPVRHRAKPRARIRQVPKSPSSAQPSSQDRTYDRSPTPNPSQQRPGKQRPRTKSKTQTTPSQIRQRRQPRLRVIPQP